MSVYKDEKTGKWIAMPWYRDWKGETRQKCKRGFDTKKDAQDWERAFMQQNAADMDMTFGAFCELYERDRRPRLKESTWLTKENIINNKLIPAFGKRVISEIETKDIIAWQNEMLAYRDEKKKPYSDTYLKTVHNQLVAIFSHAVRHYGLKSNPASTVGPIGRKESEEMQFWTKDEYLRFAEAVMDKPMSYYAFQMLYWCGIREGELLALTPADFNFNKKTVRINKNYQRIRGEDLITTPKTRKSIRTIEMPDFLCDEMQDYIRSLYKIQKNERIFPFTKCFLHHEMDRGSRKAGVKRIRIHDLRHSHISLLIDMGFSAVAIADRVGHESIDITFRYAHLFPSRQHEMAEQLNRAVALSGLPKQEYCYRKCMDRTITVQPNPRVYKALKDSLAEVLEELKRISAGVQPSNELLEDIALITTTLNGIKGRSSDDPQCGKSRQS